MKYFSLLAIVFILAVAPSIAKAQFDSHYYIELHEGDKDVAILLFDEGLPGQLEYKVIKHAIHGRLNFELSDLPNLEYTPKKLYHGHDHFVYTVSNGDETKKVKMHLNISSVNNIPEYYLKDIYFGVDETPAHMVHRIMNIKDYDDDIISYSVDELPGYFDFDETTGELSGTFSLSDITRIEDANFTISDGNVSLSRIVDIIIQPKNTYYVSVTGDDAGDGSESDPWRTIQYAADNVQSGDTVIVMPGVYDERVSLRNTGNLGNRITYKTAEPHSVLMKGFKIYSDYVTIDGFNISYDGGGSYGVIDLRSCTSTHNVGQRGMRGITIINNVIDAMYGGMLGIYGPCYDCYVAYNEIKHVFNAAFLAVGADNFIIENNYIHDGMDADFIRSFGTNGIIRNNRFINNVGGPGGNHIDFIQVFGNNGGISYNMTVEGNYIENVQSQLCQLDAFCGNNAHCVGGIHDGEICKDKPKICVGGINDGEMCDGKPSDYCNESSSGGICRDYCNESGSGGRCVSLCREGARLDSEGNFTSVTENTITDTNQTTDHWVIDEWAKGYALGVSNEWVKGYVLSVRTGNGAGNFYLIQSNTEDTLTLTDLDNNPVNLLDDGLAVGDSYAIRCRIGWYVFKNNVFYNVTNRCNCGIPNMTWTNNNFLFFTFAVALDAGGYLNMNSKYKNNLFVAGGRGTDDRGWYWMDKAPGVYADYSYVTGHPPVYGAKDSSFNETSGKNGGDPYFVNILDPLGEDNIPFTDDDGLIPWYKSPVCGNADDGGDIGAYECRECESSVPFAHFKILKDKGYDPFTVNFDASGSIACQLPITSYDWDFGDGEKGTGVMTSHSFDEGEYTVNLTVKNDLGESSSTLWDITSYYSRAPDLALHIEFENNVNDTSRGHASLWKNGEGSYAVGKFGQAGVFDGTDNGAFVYIPCTEDLDELDEITMSAWIKTDGIQKDGDRRTNTVIYKHICYNFWADSDTVSFDLDGKILKSDYINSNPDSWQHIAVTYDGSEMKIYHDASLIASTPYSQKIRSESSRDIIIGFYSGGGGYIFKGLIDDARIYSRALTQPEIEDIYQGNEVFTVPCEKDTQIASLCLCEGIERSTGYCCRRGGYRDTVCCKTGADKETCDGLVSMQELTDYIDVWYRCSGCVPDILDALDACFLPGGCF